MKAWQVSLGLRGSLHGRYRWWLLHEKNEGNVTNAFLLQTARPARCSAPLVPMPRYWNGVSAGRTSQPALTCITAGADALVEYSFNGQIQLLTCCPAASHRGVELSAGALRRTLRLPTPAPVPAKGPEGG